MTRPNRNAAIVGALNTVSPADAHCCSRWVRFTVAPTGEYSTRSA